VGDAAPIRALWRHPLRVKPQAAEAAGRRVGERLRAGGNGGCGGKGGSYHPFRVMPY
jgi:hypothetical protein